MKIYLETKDAKNHRIAIAGHNGKLVLQGEWRKDKTAAKGTLTKLLSHLGMYQWQIENVWSDLVIERPYKPGAFAKNSGPKRKPKTFIALAGKYKGQQVTERATPVELRARKDSQWITNPDGTTGTSLKAHLKPVKSTTKSGKR